ncbi:hypothetical protein [Maliponia aquimaris]|uniref:Uncharacterized protein n=1 Tax=Maliponia aquimaris TaxID=1673631 RepID=A0A238JR24_9RHOB|nr:hypothetical protein [Maliponia aquimaris]SMX33100.1 hypothetical protein MAA8898_00396 [Maliponia aquimaris]
MWTDRIALGAALSALMTPALASYANMPFHDRPFAVADLALRVLDGEAVALPTEDLPLVAAVASLLLVSELGVAEAYEEAVEDGDDGDDTEGDAYAAAYALFQTVRPWIDAVPQDAELADLVARLDALMPTAQRPQALDADPEAAEVIAQALVGRLERAANADLYLGRDLPRALETVAQLAAQGCAQVEDAQPRWFRVAALYFEDALEAPMSVMAADQAERIEDGFEALLDGDLTACATVSLAFTETRERLFP